MSLYVNIYVSAISGRVSKWYSSGMLVTHAPFSFCHNIKSKRTNQTLQSTRWIVGNNIPIFSAVLPNSHHNKMRLFITSLNWPVI